MHRPSTGSRLALAVLAMCVAGCSPAGGSRSEARRPGTVPSSPTTSVHLAPPQVVSSLPELDGDLVGEPPTLGPWRLIGRSYVPGALSDQGVASVTRASGQTEIVYTGTLTVTRRLQAAGWDHVGDPDGWDGWLVTPFQGNGPVRTKMFQVTAPSGTVTEALHPLAPRELANNSFAAVTPDGQWTVGGEWGLERRLLVFPTPVVNPAAAAGGALPLAATILLQEPVTDLQGCAFASDTTLECTDLHQLLQLRLNRPVQPDGALSASVDVVGPLPEVGGCQGIYEPEGVDLDRARQQLRVEISQPGVCNLFTQVLEYQWAGPGRLG